VEQTSRVSSLDPKQSGNFLARVAALAALLNLFLAIAKYLLGSYSGSLSLKADALHSLTDVLGSISVWLGLKFAERKTPSFPYGLYKLENLASLVSAGFIFFAAYEIAKNALLGKSEISAQKVPLAAAGLMVLALVTWFFSRWELKLARQTGSPSLAADAQHMVTEFLATGVVLAGLIGGAFGLYWVDRVAALVIAVLIVRIGLEIVVDSLKVLLDVGLEPEVLTRIADLIRAFPEVVEIKRLTGRRSGRFRFVEAEIVLDTNSLEEAHEIVTLIEEEIYDLFPDIDRVIIHFEPPVVERMVVAIPVDEKGERIISHFGCAPAFLFWEIQCVPEPKILREWREKNPFAHEERRRGVRVAEWLHARGVEAVILPREEVEEKGFIYALSALGIRPVFKPGLTLEELKQKLPCPPGTRS